MYPIVPRNKWSVAILHEYEPTRKHNSITRIEVINMLLKKAPKSKGIF